MASFVILALVVAALLAGFVAVRWRGGRERGRPSEAGQVVVVGKQAEIHLAQQTLKNVSIWSAIRDVSRTAYAMPQEYELWVQAKDAERARDVLGLDEEP